jgi:trimethylamine--corrinoid protein Co-methyltransferase
MAEAALTQLVSEKYKIPISSFGMNTDAVIADGQSQMERTVETLLTALSGISLLVGAGQVDRGNTLDPVQLVMDDELLGNVFRALRGFEVNESTLAVELVKKTGVGGNFLDTDHTLQYFQKEHRLPHGLNRKDRTAWLADGAKDLNCLAQERAITILQGDQGVPLDEAVQREPEDIYASLAEEGER